MGRQYDRALTLSVGGSSLATLAGNPDNSLRVRFKLLQRNVQAPNRAQIIISNLSSATCAGLVAKLQPPKTETVMVELSAGYLDNSGLLFKGNATQFLNGRESPTDTIFQIYAGDGDLAYNHGVISKSLAKGSTPKDHFDAFLQALQPMGITQGYIPTDLLTKFKYPRGVAFAGMVKDHLRTLALSNGCQWSIQNGALQMVPASGYVPGSPFVMNSTSGMIGMPTQTLQGIMVRCLINPQINLAEGNLVKIAQADIQQAVLSQDYTGATQNSLVPTLASDGIYRVLEIETVGDTRGKDWYMDLTCLNHDLSATFIPSGQIFNLGTGEQASAQSNNDKLLGKN